MTATALPQHTPVLICGGGPAGLALAIELGTRGVECVVVEPRAHPTRLRPRAKTLNNKTMEHFRRWGLVDRVRAAAPLPVSWSQDVSFCTTFLGDEITRLSGVLGLGDEDVSPERGQQMPQYALEELLREIVTELPGVDLRLGSRVVGISPGTGSVTVQVLDETAGTSRIEAGYVVGADGARSIVRTQIGAVYEGSQALRPNTGVVFRSDRLVRAARHRPAVQTWLLNPRTPGMMGPIDRDGLWWLIAFGVDGTSDTLDVRRVIEGAIGEEMPLEVISTDPWTARMELVDRCRSGRVFLIGDAAHLNPPFGGHGLNTGIGDAVDLGWKLAATLQGWAGPRLLDSYEIERRPLHRRVIDEAASNMATLAPELLSDDLDSAGVDGQEARRIAAVRIEQTKSAEYFSLDLVLGHRYETSPIIPPAVDVDDAWATCAAPGRRLPHLWVAPGTSTLDLVGSDHVLLAGDRAVAATLSAQADAAGLPMTVAVVGSQTAGRLGSELVLVRPDQVVAWCAPPDEPDAVADVITTVAGRSEAGGS